MKTSAQKPGDEQALRGLELGGDSGLRKPPRGLSRQK